MNKLQLYIYKSLRGFNSVSNINASEDVQRNIIDVRDALKVLDYNPAEKNLFYLISYVEGGTFFTILRTIPSMPQDHLATTIFIPDGLVISPDEMADIVQRATRMVSHTSVSAEELTDMHNLFAKEYPVADDVPVTKKSQGSEYAVCMYGGDTQRSLKDFYSALYQPGYEKYAGVLLVDADLAIDHNAHDVTYSPSTPEVPVPPPQLPNTRNRAHRSRSRLISTNSARFTALNCPWERPSLARQYNLR